MPNFSDNVYNSVENGVTFVILHHGYKNMLFDFLTCVIVEKCCRYFVGPVRFYFVFIDY
jgi:hypothetical protein